MIYQKKRITAQFIGMDYIYLHDSIVFGNNNLQVFNTFGPDQSKALMYLQDVKLADRSLVIESVPDDKQHNCLETDLTYLKPSGCFGNVQVRRLTLTKDFL